MTSMADIHAAPVLAHTLDAQDIPEGGIERRIEASAKERAELAARLDLSALDSLSLRVTLSPSGRGRYRLDGAWQAQATQTCGVTLEPIPRSFDEPLSLTLWTPEAWERHTRARGKFATDPQAEPPELIADGIIDLGGLLEELLIVALPPFPRRDDATLNWSEGETPGEGPFAALNALALGKRS